MSEVGRGRVRESLKCWWGWWSMIIKQDLQWAQLQQRGLAVFAMRNTLCLRLQCRTKAKTPSLPQLTSIAREGVSKTNPLIRGRVNDESMTNVSLIISRSQNQLLFKWQRVNDRLRWVSFNDESEILDSCKDMLVKCKWQNGKMAFDCIRLCRNKKGHFWKSQGPWLDNLITYIWSPWYDLDEWNDHDHPGTIGWQWLPQ